MTAQTFNFRLVALFFMLATATVSINAQHHEHPKKNPEERAKKQTEWMKTELSLTNEQATQVESINLKYAEKRKVLMEQIKALREEQKKELESVLTKEQVAKMEAKKSEMKEKRKGAHGKKNCDKAGGCKEKK